MTGIALFSDEQCKSEVESTFENADVNELQILRAQNDQLRLALQRLEKKCVDLEDKYEASIKANRLLQHSIMAIEKRSKEKSDEDSQKIHELYRKIEELTAQMQTLRKEQKK